MNTESALRNWLEIPKSWKLNVTVLTPQLLSRQSSLAQPRQSIGPWQLAGVSYESGWKRDKIDAVRLQGCSTASSFLRDTIESDLARLRGIEEAGTLFVILGQSACPLCGAEPAHHRRELACDGDVEAVAAAARSEIAKIDLLQKELADTQEALHQEAKTFDRRLPKLADELQSMSANMDRLISPKLSKLRATYAELADKRGEVREALSIFQTLQDMEQRREGLEKQGGDQAGSTVSDGDLPIAVAQEFAQRVEVILQAWHFPEADRVFFDAKNRDLVIANKLRTARGKGLRAITHAAFTVGLLEYCRDNGTAHPGFVILDSPLLAYREPEGSDDDLTGTDLQEQFYNYLAAAPDDRQVIIVENSDPPSPIVARPQTLMFSKNPHSGRYGFFPVRQFGFFDDTAFPTRTG